MMADRIPFRANSAILGVEGPTRASERPTTLITAVRLIRKYLSDRNQARNPFRAQGVLILILLVNLLPSGTWRVRARARSRNRDAISIHSHRRSERGGVQR